MRQYCPGCGENVQPIPIQYEYAFYCPECNYRWDHKKTYPAPSLLSPQYYCSWGRNNTKDPTTIKPFKALEYIINWFKGE